MTKKDKNKTEDFDVHQNTQAAHKEDDVCECNCNCKGDCEEKLAELENNWKRALADYQNLQKRHVDEKASIVQFSNSTLLLRILPVLDNLEMMARHSEDKGINMIVSEFKKILQEEGVSEINAENADFDAQTMDALEMVEGKENKVIEVTQKGYMFKDKVLRPATVKVGNGKSKK